VGHFTFTVSIHSVEEGPFAATIAQERGEIHRRRRLARRSGRRDRESPSSARAISGTACKLAHYQDFALLAVRSSCLRGDGILGGCVGDRGGEGLSNGKLMCKRPLKRVSGAVVWPTLSCDLGASLLGSPAAAFGE
jgi:hypothetical protein